MSIRPQPGRSNRLCTTASFCPAVDAPKLPNLLSLIYIPGRPNATHAKGLELRHLRKMPLDGKVPENPRQSPVSGVMTPAPQQKTSGGPGGRGEKPPREKSQLRRVVFGPEHRKVI